MRKIFIIAAAAALSVGVSSCQKNGGDDAGNGNGEQTSAKINFVLGATGGSSRAENNAPIGATSNETSVSNVHVFVFKPGGTAKADFGAYTAIPSGSELFTDWFDKTTVGNVTTYAMKSGKSVETSTGSVRIWVGVNLPAAVTAQIPSGGFANEDAMLAVVGTAVTMSTDNSFTMFSAVAAEPSLEKVLPGEPVPAGNIIPISVDRVVAKVVASARKDVFPANTGYVVNWTPGLDAGTVDATATAAGGVKLTYFVSHWRMFQNATDSWVAPHYSLPLGAGQYADTYKGTSTDSSINSYNESTLNNEKAFIVPASSVSPTDDELKGNPTTGLGAAQREYVGENASNGDRVSTSYVFISMKVQANAKAVWNNDINDILWVATPTWGADMVTNNDSNAKDIHVIQWDASAGRRYFTQKEDVGAIAAGVAMRASKTGGRNYNITTDGVSDGYPENGEEITMADFLVLYPQFVIKEYVFHNGYTHHHFYLNNAGTNRFDLLRNQFVHLEVTGLNDTGEEATFGAYKFTGTVGEDNEQSSYYLAPGQMTRTGSPRIPIDPMSALNPDPLTPGTIQPERTTMMITTNLRPWVYRYNTMTIGGDEF